MTGQFVSLDDDSDLEDTDGKKPPFAENFELGDRDSEKNFRKPEEGSSYEKYENPSGDDFYFSNDEASGKKDDDDSKDEEKEAAADKKVGCRTVCAPLMDYETCAVPRCDYKIGTIKDLCQYLCHHQKEHCEEVCYE